MAVKLGSRSGALQRLSLHRPLPGVLRLDVLPFVALHVATLSLLLSSDSLGLVWARAAEDDPLPTAVTDELWRHGLMVVAGLLLHLITFLWCQWSVSVHCFFTCRSVSEVRSATLVKVVPKENRGPVALCELDRSQETVSFEHLKRKYCYDPSTEEFSPIASPVDLALSHYAASRGYKSEEAEAALLKWGLNKFDIPLPKFSHLFKEHAAAPFFVFQVFCMLLWCLDENWHFALLTLVLLVVFECMIVKKRIANLQTLRDMAPPATLVNVLRNGKWNLIMSDQLVPGDLCSIKRSETPCPCDALLLRGSCVTNESMLTGESVPQIKESIEHRVGADVLSLNKKSADRLHVVLGGTRVLAHSVDAPASSGASLVKAPDGGCVAFVLRTGFNTSQGKLIRTILSSSEHVTANNGETMAFIFILLMFACAAAGFVLKKGLEDETRSRYRLLLNCTLILSSVVPPELPMQLSMAVNSSLLALASLKIFCTEPFRIPLAGKIDVCCFDKTGTLTSDDLIVDGIAGILPPTDGEKFSPMSPANNVSEETQYVLAGCHSLLYIDRQLAGDSMEKASVEAINWVFSSAGVATSRDKRREVTIHQRHPFSSALKRMACIVTLDHLSSNNLRAVVKGAPEVMATRYVSVPPFYHETYKKYTCDGYRVLALGFKSIQDAPMSEIKNIPRECLETNLHFAGFLLLRCPLKPDSLQVVESLRSSGHRVVMITGDHILTACHVAQELKLTRDSIHSLILTSSPSDPNTMSWQSVDDAVILPASPHSVGELCQKRGNELCVSGESLVKWVSLGYNLDSLVKYVRVFARVSPEQKASVLASLKNLGYTTMMCGDGTNDVGALKQAHVGVALLTTEKISGERPPVLEDSGRAFATGGSRPTNKGRKGAAAAAEPAAKRTTEAERILLQDDEAGLVRLGDASIASPFTSKQASITCTATLISQGRCTLVTTLQMFKILALNCLISAYSLSVLYLDGVKMGDTQMTFVGIITAFMFFFLSWSKPLTTLSESRPHSRIFCVYVLVSLFGQFAIHLASLMYVADMGMTLMNGVKPEIDGDFKPNMINTVVFLISASMQMATFAVNYRGHPFKQSIRENVWLFRTLLGSVPVFALLATGLIPPLNDTLEMVPLPLQVQNKLLLVMLGDLVGAWVWERLSLLVFSYPKPSLPC